MVELDNAKIQRLKFMGTRYRPAPVAMHCSIQSGFSLAETPVGEVDLEFRFSGFQLLHADKGILDETHKMTGVNVEWAFQGILAIVVHKSLILRSEGKWDGPEIYSVVPVIESLFDAEFKVPVQQLILDAQVNPADEVSADRVVKFVAVSVVCSKETWQELYNAHSLELTAGMEYYKGKNGVMAVEPVGAEDISPNRVLN